MTDASPPKPLILLVEDNETIRHAFGILLEESGYRVEQATSGQEAIEKASRLAIDLVLLDLGLPDLDGLEVTRRLKADPRTRDMPVLAITGRTLETDQNACLNAGCAGYLAKPVNSADLLSAIPKYLRETAR